MRRFLYDATLLILLLLIGLSIEDHSAETTQQKMNEFEMQIEKKKIQTKRESVSLNQIEDNNASALAKNTADVVKEVTGAGVSMIRELFEVLVDSEY